MFEWFLVFLILAAILSAQSWGMDAHRDSRVSEQSTEIFNEGATDMPDIITRLLAGLPPEMVNTTSFSA